MKFGWSKRRRQFMKKHFVPYLVRQRDAVIIAIHRLRKFFYEDLPKAMNVFTLTLIDSAEEIKKGLNRALSGMEANT